MNQGRPSRVWAALAIASVFVVLLATLSPGSSARETWIHGCWLCGPYGLADVLRNLLLFIPLGFVLPRALLSGRRAFALMVALTVAVEVAQLVIPGRDSNPADVAFNALGGLLGVVLGATSHLWIARDIGRRLRSVGVYSLVVLLCAGGVGVSAQLVLPTGVLIGQWAPVRDGFASFTGLIQSVDIEGHPVPSWTVPNGRDVYQAFMTGAPLNLGFVRGGSSEQPILLARVVMPAHRELLLLGLRGDDLILRTRSRVTGLKLFEPMVVLPGLMRGVGIGDEVTVSVSRAQDRYCAQVVERSETVCRPALTLGSAWALVVNSDGWTVLQNSAMIVVFLGLLGFSFGLLGGVRVGMIGAIGVTLGAAVVTALTHIGAAPWEIGPFLIATVGGGILHGWTRNALGVGSIGTDLEFEDAASSSEN